MRSRVNFLGQIRKGGRILGSPFELKEAVARCFKNFYSGENVVRPKLDGVSFPSIPQDVQRWLEKEFGEEEVARALEECDGDKAPGLDGFSFSFIKAGWEFLKEDFGDILSEFHRRGRINREMNATFLTLIPKVPNPVELCEYRPISLVGCWYKLLAKILANCLICLLLSVLSKGPLWRKDKFFDGVLIANELIDSRKRSTADGVLLKIDLEKAYDHVDWNFVDYMLFRFGFGETWRRWMNESTTSFSVLVNGSPLKLFKGSRGIWQGDPLSSIYLRLWWRL
ncbi:hypothetical protein AAC387_Pa12g1395 [Persea americana]